MPHRGAIRSQFRKTALCVFFEGGHCEKGRDCDFAHGEQEMRKSPDLAKTSLCQKWVHGKCPHEDRCLFAHGKRELRITEAFKRNRPKGASATRELPTQLKEYLLRFVPEIFEDAPSEGLSERNGKGLRGGIPRLGRNSARFRPAKPAASPGTLGSALRK